MFGRLGWAEILIIVVLLLILFGSHKIPGMMKNLANGINVFKSELKTTSKKADKKSDLIVGSEQKPAAKKVKKSTGKRSTKKKIQK